MTRQNGSIIGEQTTGDNSPGMWTLNDAQEKSLQGDWGSGLGTIRFLICGGGGGGGGARPSDVNAGGGGGGGVISGTEILYEGRKYDISIGSGGGGGSGSSYTPGTSGGASEFQTQAPEAPPAYPGTFFKHVAYGGGGGRSYNNSPSDPQHGGSGGGASSNPAPQTAGGGLNPTVGSGAPGTMPQPRQNSSFPDYVPGTTQGYNGGANAAPPNDRGAGGGGGAGGVGESASGQSGGDGGNGFLSDITGSNVYYGAGGGGGGPTGGGSGGNGGGGSGGGPVPTSDAVAGNVATFYGGGGGGAASRPGNPSSGAPGGDGFQGICILRYPNQFELDLSSSPAAPTQPTNNYTFKYVNEGDIGSDHYISISGPAQDIKFKRK